MPRFFRRTYRRYYPRRGRRYFRRNFYRRPSTFTSGRKTYVMRVPVEDTYTLHFTSGSNWTELCCVQPYFDISTGSGDTRPQTYYCLAPMVESDAYATYTELYDQVRIHSMAVQIGILSGIGINGTLPAIQLYTSWDRHLDSTEVAVGGDPGITPETIGNGSESQTTLITNNSAQVINRYSRASDLQERTTYHDCSLRYDQSETPSFGCMDRAWGQMGQNCGYVPGLWFSMYRQNTGSEAVVNISVRAVYTVVFRNPKYGQSNQQAGNSKALRATLERLRSKKLSAEMTAKLAEIEREMAKLEIKEVKDEPDMLDESSQVLPDVDEKKE